MGRRRSQPRDRERTRAFFKVYLPTSANRLKIPKAYVSYMQGKLPQKAVLRDVRGNIWPMKVEKIEEEFFFADSWAKFVGDNSLESGDFVIFQFDGCRTYDVKLHGKNGCEKNAIVAHEVKEERDVDEETTEVEEEGETKSMEEREEFSGSRNSNETDEDDEYAPQESETEEEELEKAQRANSKKRVAVSGAESSKKGFNGVGHGESDAAEGSDRKKKAAIHEIFESGVIPEPKNPYFVTKIRPERRDQLHVPIDVIKYYDLVLPPEIALRDKQGRQWTSKHTVWKKDGRHWYCGGWKNLCRFNGVEDDDTCVCELKRGNDGCLFIQVHVVVRAKGVCWNQRG